jgi:hypothetical protein
VLYYAYAEKIVARRICKIANGVYLEFATLWIVKYNYSSKPSLRSWRRITKSHRGCRRLGQSTFVVKSIIYWEPKTYPPRLGPITEVPDPATLVQSSFRKLRGYLENFIRWLVQYEFRIACISCHLGARP